MLDPSNGIDMKSCRICLSKRALCPLFKYKLTGNYAEMLTAVADVKVAANDGLPEKICNKCCSALEKAYLLKTVAERNDKRMRKLLARTQVPTKKIAFDSFTDIKSEIGPLAIKSEPKWEMEIDVHGDVSTKPIENIEGKDIVIANTVIRKVEPGTEEPSKKDDIFSSKDVDVTWKSTKAPPEIIDLDAEYLDDDIFQDDDSDADYVPPTDNKKTKFKKPKLSDIKVFKGKKPVMRKVKILRKQEDFDNNVFRNSKDDETQRMVKTKATTITCYPIMKNGSRGPPIMLKRPKDATVLRLNTNYKGRTSGDGPKVVRRDKPVRMVRSAKAIVKQREKLVCPVCGILTFTLGNHIATHQEKKRYTCSQCPRSFAQKSNLLVHTKQHTGVKDQICEVCGAGFYSQKSLVRHNLIHKGDRPFPCNLCNKRFIARCDLNRHLRIHSGYKPYKCATCTMSFNAKHQLQNHERMHTGERPYTCQVCNVAFSYKVNLNNHVYKVHGINLKFKSIHVVTEEILRREMGLVSETRAAIAHIMPQLTDAPTPAAHETVTESAVYTIKY